MRLLIKHCNVQYGAEVIIRDIDFEIHDNEKISVVGRNGCGKTTLLKLISGNIPTGDPEGNERAVFQLAGRQTIGYLEQISFEDPQVSVRSELNKIFEEAFGVRDRMREVEALLSKDPSDRLLGEYSSLQKRWDALRGDSLEREMLIMFQKFGFPAEDLDRAIGTFSGGQQTKIAFIKLLLTHPDILLLDEPTRRTPISYAVFCLKKKKNKRRRNRK